MGSQVRQLELPQGRQLDILLIGLSGHGKSATGNSILLECNIFKSSGGPASTTKGFCAQGRQIDGRSIRVFDTPGINDSHKLSTEEDEESLVKELKAAHKKCRIGYEAIVLVYSYAAKFNKEDRKYIDSWISHIGRDNFMSHGILVTTYGDNFADDYPNKSIKDWWENQDHSFRWLYENCGKRCVLFNNRTRDGIQRKKQLRNLIVEIDGLETKGTAFIPNICKISAGDAEKQGAEKKLSSNLAKVDQLFDTILRELEIFICYTVQCNSTLSIIYHHMEQLDKTLMDESNKKLKKAINQDVAKLKNELSKLPNLEGCPEERLKSKENMCKMIKDMKLSLRHCNEDTRLSIFLRDILPSVAGPTAVVVGASVGVATASVVIAPIVVVSGAVVGVFSLTSNAIRYGPRIWDYIVNKTKKQE